MGPLILGNISKAQQSPTKYIYIYIYITVTKLEVHFNEEW